MLIILQAMNIKYLLISIDKSDEVIVINCDQLDCKYSIVKWCEKSEQLCAFSSVTFKWKNEECKGKPLFISGIFSLFN